MTENATDASATEPARRVAERWSADQFHQPALQFARTDMVCVRSSESVAEALTSIRESQTTGRIVYFYVLDEANRLVGVIPTRRLLMSPVSMAVAEVMISPVRTLPASATLFDACKEFTEHRLLAYPIVDDAGQLLGVIDVEVYTDRMSEFARREESDDVFQLIGVRLSSIEQSSLWGGFLLRFPWLLCNIGGGLACAVLTNFQADLIAQAIVLAMFIPVVLALAESVSIQALSLALQESNHSQSGGQCLLRFLREAVIGLLLGATCGLIVGLVAYLWQHQWTVGVVIFAAISFTVMTSSLIGRLIPWMLRLFSRDPQVASGPIVLASADLVTLSSYLAIGRALLLN